MNDDTTRRSRLGRSTPLVELEIVDGIAAVTLASPDTGNVISFEWAREFRDICTSIADQNDAIRVVTISARGRFFCVGGDVSLFAHADDPYATLKRLTGDLHSGLLALRSVDAPVIASVQGAAAGAGLSIVLGSDLAIAGASATFTTAYTAVGLSCDGGCSYWLPRRVGDRLATELMLTNRRVDADEAVRIGIVNETVPDAELAGRTIELANRLANGPTAAYGAVKRLLDSGETAHSLEQQLALEAESMCELAAGPTGREGAAAFLERRKPEFTR